MNIKMKLLIASLILMIAIECTYVAKKNLKRNRKFQTRGDRFSGIWGSTTTSSNNKHHQQ